MLISMIGNAPNIRPLTPYDTSNRDQDKSRSQRGHYPGVQKGPALPNFFNDENSSAACSFIRER